MKQYTKPKTLIIQNETLMAAVCNETFIYTSKGGVSNGWAKVCYHYRIYPADGMFTYRDNVNAKVINIPPNAVFNSSAETLSDGREFKSGGVYLTKSELGWRDFQGTNGTCHFIGDIFINGVLIDETNISQYTIGEAVPLN